MPVAHSAPYVKSALRVAESLGLLVIALATVVAGFQEVMVMVHAGKVTLGDLLLMFIFLEVLAMVGVFYSSGNLPVRIPIFIAIVALARYMILDTKALTEERIMAVSAGICLLAISAILISYGESRDRAAGEKAP